MIDPIQDFESACRDARVDPVDAIVRGGLHRATWFRWKNEKFLPTMRSMGKAMTGLDALKAERQRAA